MAEVQFVDGSVRHVPLTNITHVGEEGARRATAMYEGKEYDVYQNGVDGDYTWYEQISYETYMLLKGTNLNGIVEGTVEGRYEKEEAMYLLQQD